MADSQTLAEVVQALLFKLTGLSTLTAQREFAENRMRRGRAGLVKALAAEWGDPIPRGKEHLAARDTLYRLLDKVLPSFIAEVIRDLQEKAGLVDEIVSRLPNRSVLAMIDTTVDLLINTTFDGGVGGGGEET